MKILFVCAHPDDLEFSVSNIMISLAKTHAVRILSMTQGEYGTYNLKLRGEKLAQIRMKELRQAASIEGVHYVTFMGCLDAHLEINRDIINKIKNYIKDYQPDVIFAPECLYTYYPHNDHIHAGLIIYYLVKSMKFNKRPKLYMFHSYVNTHFFPMIHWKTQSKALKTHKSQFWLLLPTYPLRFLIGIYFGRRLPRALWARTLLAEAVRRVDFQQDTQRILGLKHRLFGRLVSKLKIFFTLQDLDLTYKKEKKN